MSLKFFFINLAIFFFNVAALFLFRRIAFRWHFLIDYPQSRSSHQRPTVRGAGAVFFLSTLLSWIYLEMRLGTGYMESFIIGAIFLAGVSFVDDIRRLPVKIRILTHILAATIFLHQVRPPSILLEHFGLYALLWYPACIFFIVSAINLYNFMDGIDGMCVLHAIAVLFCWIVFSYALTGGVNYWMISLLSALLAFTLFNWHPAKVFMGDTGSTFLGFTFSCLAITQLNNVPRLMNFSAFVFLMLPFFFDTSFTVLCRILKGKKIYLPHRDFLFHRLVLSGYSHSSVSMAYTVITLFNALLVVLIYSRSIGILVGLPLTIVPYLALYLWVLQSTVKTNKARVQYLAAAYSGDRSFEPAR